MIITVDNDDQLKLEPNLQGSHSRSVVMGDKVDGGRFFQAERKDEETYTYHLDQFHASVKRD